MFFILKKKKEYKKGHSLQNKLVCPWYNAVHLGGKGLSFV